MKKTLKYTPAILTIMAVLFASLFILDAFIVTREKQTEIEELHRDSAVELELIATCIAEPLLRHSFAEVEQFIQQWGLKQSHILQIRAVTPEGFLLTEFRRGDAQPKDTLNLQHDIRFEDRHLLTLHIALDLTPL
ncbi:MAG: hypothetical protein OEV73_11040, partial [Desulfobulbaceae bacterium]|nr:hypothetical protein [Desulfobulbaceae bacterium]